MTDTDKWKKPFIKSLPLEYKIFWLYLLDDCDHAGLWHVDFEVAELRLGTKLSKTKAEGLFSEKVVLLDNGTKWFIPDFITFQYGELTEKNKMYKPVSLVLNKYKLMGHLSPINGVKVKDKGKEEVKEELWTQIKNSFFNDFRWIEKFCRDKEVNKGDMERQMKQFIVDVDLSNDFKDLKELQGHFLHSFNLGKYTKSSVSTKEQKEAEKGIEIARRAQMSKVS